ncbi:MAG: hypothetical protein Q4G21_03190 [Dermabacter sp.]|nr:hypothetical protein [Dermabacter sp.]
MKRQELAKAYNEELLRRLTAALNDRPHGTDYGLRVAHEGRFVEATLDTSCGQGKLVVVISGENVSMYLGSEYYLLWQWALEDYPESPRELLVAEVLSRLAGALRDPSGAKVSESARSIRVDLGDGESVELVKKRGCLIPGWFSWSGASPEFNHLEGEYATMLTRDAEQEGGGDEA